jgi:hypothetical protein
MTRRNTSFEAEQIRQLALIAHLSPPSWQTSATESSGRRRRCSPKITSFQYYRPISSGYADDLRQRNLISEESDVPDVQFC